MERCGNSAEDSVEGIADGALPSSRPNEAVRRYAREKIQFYGLGSGLAGTRTAIPPDLRISWGIQHLG